MSDTQHKDFPTEFVCPYSAGMDFEQAIAKARSLYAEGDLDGAQELLSHLEKRYVRAARMFDLYGDVLLRRGFVKDGIRYKTLHEILKGTFKIAKEEADAMEAKMRRIAPSRAAATDYLTTPELGAKGTASAPEPEPVWAAELEESEPAASDELFPVTAAMGREFIRQGHYARAVDVFNVLLEKTPDDTDLRDARERAHAMLRKKKLLGVLQGWLENIEKWKAGPSTGS